MPIDGDEPVVPSGEPTPSATEAPADAAADELVAQPTPPGDQPSVAAPPGEPIGHSGLYWRFALGLIAIDQISKAVVRSVVPLYETRPLVNGVVDLVHVRNEGVAFGLLNNLNLRYKWTITTALAMAALIGIAYYANHVRREERFARIGLSMILGGAIGNLIDRAVSGYVLDFVDVYYGTWHFWAFNVADASITIGAILVFIDLLLVKPHASHSV
jgi:signal peptidase II